VILKAIAKKPTDRYQTGAEFAKALRSVETVGGQVKRPAAPAGGRGKPASPQPEAEAAPEKVESISTYLQSMAQAAYAPPMPAPAGDIATDQLLIVTEGEPPRTFPISKTPIEIGREEGLDLVLKSPKVSRHQARLERRKDGQYTIMDLGSSNGTYLGDAKLLSNIAEVWPPETMVRMGNFWLTLQRASQAYLTGRAVLNVPSVASAGFAPGFQGGPAGAAMPPQANPAFGGMQSGIAITLTPTSLTIEPGGRMDLRVEVLNQSELVERVGHDADDDAPTDAEQQGQHLDQLPSTAHLQQHRWTTSIHRPCDQSGARQGDRACNRAADDQSVLSVRNGYAAASHPQSGRTARQGHK
jgi:hypothetical protein